MNKKKGIIYFTALAIFTLASAFSATFAWFYDSVTLSDIDMSGDSSAAYFAYGDGTSDHPYGIRAPVHLYNLAWLQYSGFFNKDTNTDGTLDKQYYFEIDKSVGELDMSGWVLPPIGTEDYPFLGNFNGNKVVIKNLNVSNIANLSKPASINYNKQPTIVGFFGVVGKIGDNPSYTYTSSANSVYNVTLDSITVESKTQETLIGLAGGYVNGELSGVKVGGTSQIITNGNARTSYYDGLSKHGLVGFTTNEGSKANTEYTQKVSAKYSEGGTDSSGSNWGGSINIKNLNERIYNMMNVKSDISQDDPSLAVNHPTESNQTTLALGSAGKTILSKLHQRTSNASTAGNGHRYYYDSENRVSIALLGNESRNTTTSSYRMNQSPLTNSTLFSFEESGAHTLKANDGTTYSTTVPGTILPLNVGSKGDGYLTSREKNTGYIIGGSKSKSGTDNYQSRTTVRTASSLIEWIQRSTNTTTSFGNTNMLEILTNKSADYSSSNYGRISDVFNENNVNVSSLMASFNDGEGRVISHSNLKKYDASRRTLDSILKDTNFVHGLHFTGSLININNKETLDVAYINGTSPTNYELPKSSIDFNLKEDGYINFFAGSYQNNGMNADSFFSLHIITRSNNKLSNIREISKIYKNLDPSTKADFPYLYLIKNTSTYTTGTSTVSGDLAGDLVFDMRFLWRDPPLDGAIYYFEIPVNKGEYAMSSVENENSSPRTGYGNGAYLMYLDIGASDRKADEVQAYGITTITTGSGTFPIGVDFGTSDVVGTNGGETLGVFIVAGNTSNGTITFTVNDTTIGYESDYSTTYSFFTKEVTGADPPTKVEPPANGTRIVTAKVETLDSHTWDIIIVDDMSIADNQVWYTYESIIKDKGTNNEAIITDPSLLPTSFTDSMAELRAAIKTDVVTLERDSGTDAFNAVPTYSGTDNTTVDIALELRTSTIIVKDIATDYTIKINGTDVSENDPYPAS